MDNNFIQYHQVQINTKPNEKNIFLDSDLECIGLCQNDTNCQGVSYYKLNYIEDNKDTSIGNDVNTNPANFNKTNCGFLTNINSSNQITPSKNKTTLVKSKYLQLNGKLANSNKTFYLKIGSKYLGISKNHNNLYLVSNDDILLASKFKFGSQNNIFVETETNKCLTINGVYIILDNCDEQSEKQKFIYENKLKTIRPSIIHSVETSGSDSGIIVLSSLDETTNTQAQLTPQMCFTLNEINGDNRIRLVECDYELNKIQKVTPIDTTDKTNLNSTSNSNENEPFSSYVYEGEFDSIVDNVNFCSDPTYKIIITLILLGIIGFFIWFVSRKKYWDDKISDIAETASPFK